MVYYGDKGKIIEQGRNAYRKIIGDGQVRREKWNWPLAAAEHGIPHAGGGLLKPVHRRCPAVALAGPATRQFEWTMRC